VGKAIEKLLEILNRHQMKINQVNAEQPISHQRGEWGEIRQSTSRQILQALLSDPDIPIIEYGPDAKIEWPEYFAGGWFIDDYGNKITIDDVVRRAGWVLPVKVKKK